MKGGRKTHITEQRATLSEDDTVFVVVIQCEQNNKKVCAVHSFVDPKFKCLK